MTAYSVEALLEAALDCSWSIHIVLDVLLAKKFIRSFSVDWCYCAAINEYTTSKSKEREAL